MAVRVRYNTDSEFAPNAGPSEDYEFRLRPWPEYRLPPEAVSDTDALPPLAPAPEEAYSFRLRGWPPPSAVLWELHDDGIAGFQPPAVPGVYLYVESKQPTLYVESKQPTIQCETRRPTLYLESILP